MNTSLSLSERSGRQALENSIINGILKLGHKKLRKLHKKLYNLCFSGCVTRILESVEVL
jgi:hypothetical protein